QHVVMMLTENKFVFDHLPVLGSAGAMTLGNEAVMAPSGTIHHIGAAALNAADDKVELQLVKHGMTQEDGGWGGPSHGGWKANSATSSIITLNNEDHGALKNADSIHGGNDSISGQVSENGAAP